MDRRDIYDINVSAYDADANRFLEARWKKDKKNYEIVKKEILRHLKPKQNDILLDVGCGPGTWSEILSEFTSNLHVIDISSGMINGAKKRCPNAMFILCSGDDLPYQHGLFDKILSVRVFEYFPDKDKTIKEFYRVLRSNGRLILITKSTPLIWRIPDYIIYVLRNPSSIYNRIKNRPPKIVLWEKKISPPNLKKLLAENDFKNIEHRPLTFSSPDRNKKIEPILRILAKIFWPVYYIFCESYIIIAEKNSKSP